MTIYNLACKRNIVLHNDHTDNSGGPHKSKIVRLQPSSSYAHQISGVIRTYITLTRHNIVVVIGKYIIASSVLHLLVNRAASFAAITLFYATTVDMSTIYFNIIKVFIQL